MAELGRRRACRWLAAGAVLSPLPAAPQVRVAVTLRRFEIDPAEIRLPAGVPAVLVLRSTDLLHGFAVPALGARADVPPGATAELHLPAAPAGRYATLCDNFCGEGHERMVGMLVVA